MEIRDRIKDFRRVKASSLSPNPRNWRTHPEPQRDALRGILAEIGYADALLVRELQDGTLELVDGHLRAETTPDQEVPVLVLDLDQDEANKLLTLLDPLAAMAEADLESLQKLIGQVETESADLQLLLDELANQTMPITLGDIPDAPETVQENIDEINEINKARKRAKSAMSERHDTERFACVVCPTRLHREKLMESLGLPSDERYVALEMIDIRPKGAPSPLNFSDGMRRVAAQPHKSGDAG